MNRVSFSPLYRSAAGFDRMASLLNGVGRSELNAQGFPAYDIEALTDNRYEVTLALPGYARSDLDLQVDNGVLTVTGRAEDEQGHATEARRFLHNGINKQGFQRRFNLAEHVDVVDARLRDGLLVIELVREIPEAMKPKSINIQVDTALPEQAPADSEAA